jgi:predicted transcriptional regulator YdeE
MAGYIRIKHEALSADSFIEAEDIKICELTDEEVEWVKDSAPSGEVDIYIPVKALRSILRKVI